MTTVYASFDVESDGPNVVTNSMIAFGIVFTDNEGNEISTFKRNIKALDTRQQDPKTMYEFWNANEENKKMYDEIISNSVSAEDAIKDLAKELHKFKENKIKWIARPASYDWPWIKSYYEIFKPKFVTMYDSPPDIGFKAECLSSMLWMYVQINNLTKEQSNTKWNEFTEGLKLTHDPLDDCRVQSKVFHNLCKELKIKL